MKSLTKEKLMTNLFLFLWKRGINNFIKLYFYGAFDGAYLAQCEDWEEDPEDKSTWVR